MAHQPQKQLFSPISGKSDPDWLAERQQTLGSAKAKLRRSGMFIATAPPAYFFKLRGSGMPPTPRHHAAPLGLAGVLVGFACYKHSAPTELAASVVPTGTWQPYGRRPGVEIPPRQGPDRVRQWFYPLNS